MAEFRLIDHFQVRAESGEIHIIDVYQNFIDTTAGAKFHEEITNVMDYRLNGLPVERINDNSFRDYVTGETYKKI